jgi:hypothetical protein
MAKPLFHTQYVSLEAAAGQLGLPQQHLLDAATVGAFRKSLRVKVGDGFAWYLHAKELQSYLGWLEYMPNGETLEDRRGVTRKDFFESAKRMGLDDKEDADAADMEAMGVDVVVPS